MQEKLKTFFDRYGILISIAFGIVIFSSKLGWPVLDPTNIRWMRTSGSDWMPDLAAWIYFRQSPWDFPLGLFEGYSYPETVSVGLTGAIPLLAVPFKLISGILPAEFQYFGIWLLMCFILQALFSYKLMGAVGIKDSVIKTIGSCLFVLSYSFLDRIGHINLCGHWLIVAGIYGYFQWNTWGKALIYHCLLVAASVWVHPYLILLTLCIGGAHFLNQFICRDLSWWKMPISWILLILSALAAWIALGNHVLDSEQAVSTGFGIFSANLNTFFTPKIDTPLVSAWPRYDEGQYEGTAYLGLGVLLFVAMSLILLISSKLRIKWDRKYIAVSLTALGLFIYALSHIITFNEHILWEIELDPELMDKLAIFRASGRYVWLIQYLIMLLIIIALDRAKIKSKWQYLVGIAMVLINVVDFHDVIKRDKYVKVHRPTIDNFQEDIWREIICESDIFRMYPSHEREYQKFGDDMEFAYIAGGCNRVFNAGHLARFNQDQRESFAKRFYDTISVRTEDKTLLSQYTIITGARFSDDVDKLFSSDNHITFEINGYYAFVPTDQEELIETLKKQSDSTSVLSNKEYLGAFAQRYHDHTLLMSIKDEGTQSLHYCEDFLRMMDQKQSRIRNVGFRESYVSIFGVSQKEEKLQDETHKICVIDTTLTFIKNGQAIEKSIEISSAGMENGNKARIFVDGHDYALNERGLNIVILDSSGQVVESTVFDTYESCHHFTEQVSVFHKVWKIR